jgi:hypothetical protein
MTLFGTVGNDAVSNALGSVRARPSTECDGRTPAKYEPGRDPTSDGGSSPARALSGPPQTTIRQAVGTGQALRSYFRRCTTVVSVSAGSGIGSP